MFSGFSKPLHSVPFGFIRTFLYPALLASDTTYDKKPLKGRSVMSRNPSTAMNLKQECLMYSGRMMTQKHGMYSN